MSGKINEILTTVNQHNTLDEQYNARNSIGFTNLYPNIPNGNDNTPLYWDGTMFRESYSLLPIAEVNNSITDADYRNLLLYSFSDADTRYYPENGKILLLHNHYGNRDSLTVYGDSIWIGGVNEPYKKVVTACTITEPKSHGDSEQNWKSTLEPYGSTFKSYGTEIALIGDGSSSIGMIEILTNGQTISISPECVGSGITRIILPKAGGLLMTEKKIDEILNDSITQEVEGIPQYTSRFIIAPNFTPTIQMTDGVGTYTISYDLINIHGDNIGTLDLDIRSIDIAIMSRIMVNVTITLNDESKTLVGKAYNVAAYGKTTSSIWRSKLIGKSYSSYTDIEDGTNSAVIFLSGFVPYSAYSDLTSIGNNELTFSDGTVILCESNLCFGCNSSATEPITVKSLAINMYQKNS